VLVLDVLDVLDASSPPLLLVVLPPLSSPPPLVLVDPFMYMPLDPPGAPDDPPLEPPKLLFMIEPDDPPDEPNLPEGVGSPAAQAPTTPLAVTAATSPATLNPAQSIDSLVYAEDEPTQRGYPCED
jgi:hypothetical protein